MGTSPIIPVLFQSPQSCSDPLTLYSPMRTIPECREHSHLVLSHLAPWRSLTLVGMVLCCRHAVSWAVCCGHCNSAGPLLSCPAGFGTPPLEPGCLGGGRSPLSPGQPREAQVGCSAGPWPAPWPHRLHTGLSIWSRGHSARSREAVHPGQWVR